jgi:hypothetical protein
MVSSTIDPATTGLPSLDNVMQGVRPGDNIVWQVSQIDDYLAFVRPFCADALAKGRRLTYFRFAKHKPLVEAGPGVQVCVVDPKDGFETFITEIRRVIEANGVGAYYVFDCHSELAREAFSDRMLGNFFVLTCPFLYELETVTYFAVLRDYNSYHAAQPIAETAQVLIEVYNHHDKFFIHLLKVDQRFSPTMYLLHAWEGDQFVPITESVTIADVLTSTHWPGLQSASYRHLGQWDRRLMQAEELLQAYRKRLVQRRVVDDAFHRLLPQLVSNDAPIVELATKYLKLDDLIYIWKRMIGYGKIGGKTAGMLIARAILCKHSKRMRELLEAHDSFFIGSDVFYTFLILNGCWLDRQRQKNPETFLQGLDAAQERIMAGSFPEYLLHRFVDMLDYFGQSPIIVRSSSLLEDNFESAFAGKYESVFCANQGDREQRLAEFLQAVRRIYASAMSEEALRYRAKRGVLDKDEQMALLVQRVSGDIYGTLFFPQLAGVAFSYNSYAWHETIDPEAGMMRLVVGLGTRAVDRADDDYTRVVALNAPDMRPEGSFNEVRKVAQRRIDVIDLADNCAASRYFVDVVRQTSRLPVRMLATLDEESGRGLVNADGSERQSWVITFDPLFAETPFIEDMRSMLRILQRAYGRHVDIEFAANFTPDGTYRINLLQCRPLQVKVSGVVDATRVPPVDAERVIVQARAGVVGTSRVMQVDRVIYVVPTVYGHLAEKDRWAVARLIGRITRASGTEKTLMLIGPGRWGTRMPSLGVPVSFSEISPVSVLCEIDTMHEGLVPDLSLGTHFFNEMVEMDMLYIALFSTRRGNHFDETHLRHSPNLLTELLPDEGAWTETVWVVDGDPKARMYLRADVLKQEATLYWHPRRPLRPLRGGK